MNKDIENRVKKMIDKKERNYYCLKTISKNKDICIQLIDNVIQKIKESKAEYLEGYELKVNNEVRTPVVRKKQEYEWVTPKIENIKIDITLKNKSEQLNIGNIDCDIEKYYSPYRGNLDTYNIHINYISIFDNYKNKGYGTYILRHVPMIISHIIRGKIYTVSTTTNIFKYDKYKIYEYTYEERVKRLTNWLNNNGYTISSDYIENNGTEIPVFKMKLDEDDNVMGAIKNLEKEISELCFAVWHSDNDDYVKQELKRCNDISKNIINEKYNIYDKEEKIIKMQDIKKEFVRKYKEQKEIREDEIKLIDDIIIKYNSISMEQLDLLENDTFDDIVIKLYCKSFNLGYVSRVLAELGYFTKNKEGEKRKYTYEKIKYIIEDSNTKYRELKKYANNILIANRISQ